jgi:hypothetical protein
MIPFTHGISDSLNNQLWFKIYWKTNSNNFRDDEIDYNKINEKKSIIFIGDSHTAGYGIKKVKNRYSNILKEKCKKNYNFINTGIPSTNLDIHIENAKKITKDNDIIVWQYFCDDILFCDKVYSDLKNKFPNIDTILYPEFKLNNILKFMFYNSFLYNLYFITSNSEKRINEFIGIFKYIYNKDNQKLIENEIIKFKDYCDDRKIRLFVLIIPFLIDEKISAEIYTDSISKIFIKYNIETINLSDFTKNIKYNKTINKYDGHANEKVHLLISKILDEKLNNN